MAHFRVILVLPLLVGILNCGVKGDPVPYVSLHSASAEATARQAAPPPPSARQAAPPEAPKPEAGSKPTTQKDER